MDIASVDGLQAMDFRLDILRNMYVIERRRAAIVKDSSQLSSERLWKIISGPLAAATAQT
jgi:hypothetical protein